MGAPGIEIGGQGDGRPGVDEAPGRGPLVHHQEERHARQEDGRRVARGEAGDALVGDGDEVFGRRGPDLGGELRSAQGDELVGVDLDLEAGGLWPRRRASASPRA